MKNTPYIRQVRHAHCKQARFKKGIAPIIIALIIALLAGGGYVVVKTNPGLAKKLGIEKQEEKKELIAEQKVKVAELGFCYDFSVDLKKGARGNNVGVLNKILVKEKLMADPEEPLSLTVFYKETTAAVAKFQAKYGIKQTGIVDSDTRLQLNKLYGCKVEGTSDWKTYTNTKFGFEMKYPANYFIHDYGVIPDTAVTAAVIGITDSKETYDSTGTNKVVVVYVSKLPVGFKNSEEYLKYMHASYPALKEVKVTKENRVDLGGVEGLQFFGVQKDSETGREANIQSIVGYSNKTGYEVTSYSSDSPLFADILSTFKFTK